MNTSEIWEMIWDHGEYDETTLYYVRMLTYPLPGTKLEDLTPEPEKHASPRKSGIPHQKRRLYGREEKTKEVRRNGHRHRGCGDDDCPICSGNRIFPGKKRAKCAELQQLDELQELPEYLRY